MAEWLRRMLRLSYALYHKAATIVRLAGIVVGSIPTPGIVFHAWSQVTSVEVDSILILWIH